MPVAGRDVSGTRVIARLSVIGNNHVNTIWLVVYEYA